MRPSRLARERSSMRAAAVVKTASKPFWIARVFLVLREPKAANSLLRQIIRT